MLYWLQVSLWPDCKKLVSGVSSLMASDKPCPQLQLSLIAPCIIDLISAQTSQEGIKFTKAKEWLRAYCPNIYTVCWRRLCGCTHLFRCTLAGTPVLKRQSWARSVFTLVFKFFKVEFSQQVTLGSKVLDQNSLEHRKRKNCSRMFGCVLKTCNVLPVNIKLLVDLSRHKKVFVWYILFYLSWPFS